MESLEPRRLFSAGANLVSGVIVVRPFNGLANVMSVQNSGDDTSIDVTINATTAGGVNKNFTASFPRTKTITAVSIFGAAKADTISAGTVNGILGVPITIKAAGGDNQISVGDDDATIEGGSGADTIVCGDGNDIIRGYGGNDRITVGDGANQIDGGPGNDTIFAGNGNNIIAGEAGNDSITVGDGSNSIYGGPGNDDIVAGNGDNTIWGEAGNDTIHVGNGDNTIGAILGKNTIVTGSGHDTYVVRTENGLAGQFTNFDSSKDTILILKTEPNPPKI
jgi:Ca2+-binding RTX toxin-like protein